MGMMEAVKSVLVQNYANFNGRARRSEYWYYSLALGIVNLILQGVAKIVPILGIVSIVVSLAVMIPGLAVTARRLHDIGKSGWWMLISLIPLVGGILMLIWMIKDSEYGTNKFGPNPKGQGGDMQGFDQGYDPYL